MRYLKQSTAHTFRIGPFVDATDAVTAETGLTLSQADYRLSKAGGAFAQKGDTTAGAHDENGWYTCILNTTDTNTLGPLTIAVHESGALPVWEYCTVLAANVYDSLIGGGDTLDVQVTGMGADTVTASALATDAVTEIQSGLATASALSTVAGYIDTEVATIVTQTTAASIRSAVGLASANLDTQFAAVQADTDNIQTRLPAALVSGRIDASVGAMAANTLTASALATDAVTEISTAVGTPTTIAEAVLEAEIAVADDVSAAGTPTVRRRLRQLWQDNVKR